MKHKIAFILPLFFVSLDVEANYTGQFPLSEARVFFDSEDYKVVDVAANLLADDVERVCGKRLQTATAQSLKKVPDVPVVIAGTIGKSRLIDEFISKKAIDVGAIKGKWESTLTTTVMLPGRKSPLLVIAGSDRRGTAYGLMTISEEIGVSPWYWWADVTPRKQSEIKLKSGCFVQGEPSVQYRGIFINDERFGGWALWSERTFETETHQVGPKTYQKVFELLLRLKANYLWPAMHPGTQAFNDNPENARLADDYAIVMGSSHCEQMLRNNEGEWKAVNERTGGSLGGFNYVTNRQTMQNYWETRVKTNGRYENIYTLGLRGIHDYPMEGANTTEERVQIMQQAINDQRDMLRRNINKPVEEVPQILCTYEEVLDAYHNGLQIPEDVTMLWADDKHGYTRNLCNPEEMKRKGGAGIYYHLSYHGDPASWIWLSPLSPSFIATELTKAYEYGAQKIWILNVGDIKPAEKEISFAMKLAWDINKWKPENAHSFIQQWVSNIFGEELGKAIAEMQAEYYRLQASGKDSHVYFVNFDDSQIASRINAYRQIAEQAMSLERQVPEELRNAYFELVLYPIRGAQMLNEYQLLSRRSLAEAAQGKGAQALADAERVKQMFNELNAWTERYNTQTADGKWKEFFNWQPYHWTRSNKMDAPVCTPEILAEAKHQPTGFLNVRKALSAEGISIHSDDDCSVPLWIEALTPTHNFSKERKDNIYCQVNIGSESFEGAATPINNIWHAPFVGPMWSQVGTLNLKKGDNLMHISRIKEGTRIDSIFIGVYPPFPAAPLQRIAAADYKTKRDGKVGTLTTISGLGYTDGVTVRPFTTPSYAVEDYASAPCLEYEADVKAGSNIFEVRTLPTLHIYEGRDARYAVQIGDGEPQVFSIHADDFSAEWRWNVLRGYASRSVCTQAAADGKQKIRIYLLDPGIVVQEILRKAK